MLHHPSVLVVEDEAISRHALTWLLAASGYMTEAYATAEDALEAIDHEQSPDIALVDVDLPGMSGLELAVKLMRVNPKLRVVLLTAAEGDRIERFRKSNDVGYVRKPVNFSELLHMLASSGPVD
jgi:CheY-like chemotaxis protein